MRILYLGWSYTTHDRRFLELIASAHDAYFLRLSAAPPHDVRSLPAGVTEVSWDRPANIGTSPNAWAALAPGVATAIVRVQPHLVHAGPIQSAGLVAARARTGRLALMSWARDLLVDADRGDEWLSATREAFAAADLFVCDSDVVRARARTLADYPDDRILQLPWGIDVETFRPGPDDTGLRARFGWRDALVVIWTRTWEPLYGLDVGLRAFALLRARYPAARLLLAGDGPDRERVLRSIDEMSLGDAVRILGRLGQPELAAAYRAADIYLSCAEVDGTSISLLEAMGTGLPVVVSDIPGNREWVTDVGGRLAAVGDASAFADALGEIGGRAPGARNDIGRANRAVVLARADWRLVAGRLLRAYEGLAPLAGGPA